MTRTLRRRLRVLEIYCAATLLIAIGAAASAFRQPAAPASFGEITAERINIVDANGTLRLVISNKDRMHPGVIGGKVIQRPRPYAGFLFFNDQGDEAGGMTLTGRAENGRRTASAGLMFDQLGQDQTIGFEYAEDNGQRDAAFKVWDRPEAPLSDLVEQLNAANAIADPAERQAAVARARAAAPKPSQRVFVGKTRDRTASIVLADAQGRSRLALKVDADGAASIEFLDAAGAVVQRIAPAR
ncbi:MAG TPA: hypothetical protein VKD69_02930 [Vicinamibacterales bacterium]|nr:hypothetical protein [Vicinamibacterales bacterium]